MNTGCAKNKQIEHALIHIYTFQFISFWIFSFVIVEFAEHF